MADASPEFSTIGPGFSNPVETTQEVFRLTLDAIARPGRVVALPNGVRAGGRLGSAATALALTLLDYETPIWLDSSLSKAVPFLQFHCGSPVVTIPCDSRFAFAADLAKLPPFTAFDLGTEEYPDRSTSLVIEVPELGEGGPLSLRGPGIKAEAHLTVAGLSAGFWCDRSEMALLFPLGIDLFLTCGQRLAALPRTTHVEA
jgi:alpha-D-ribose 1-methylphosphonate 5-triphosphate synthase subunit PhnH